MATARDGLKHAGKVDAIRRRAPDDAAHRLTTVALSAKVSDSPVGGSFTSSGNATTRQAFQPLISWASRY